MAFDRGVRLCGVGEREIEREIDVVGVGRERACGGRERAGGGWWEIRDLGWGGVDFGENVNSQPRSCTELET